MFIVFFLGQKCCANISDNGRKYCKEKTVKIASNIEQKKMQTFLSNINDYESYKK